MAVLVRIMMMVLAYVLACIAASLILTIGTLTSEWDDLTALGMQSVAVWAVVMVGATAIAAIAMMPALLVIALTEGFAWRSSLIYAALGGVLQVWNYRQISPGSVGVERAIDILIIAIVGGITRPIGPFIGALIFVLLRTFTLDFLVAIGLDGNRFRLLIGLGFLVIVLFSPDGIVGLWERWHRRGEGQMQPGGERHG